VVFFIERHPPLIVQDLWRRICAGATVVRRNLLDLRRSLEETRRLPAMGGKTGPQRGRGRAMLAAAPSPQRKLGEFGWTAVSVA
jgi:hypothetical protein